MRRRTKTAIALGVLVCLVLPVVVILIPTATQATTQVITTSQIDATIQLASPNSNFGTTQNVAVQSWPADDSRFLIQFDLSSLNIPPTNHIVSATMTLDILAVIQGPGSFDYPKTVEAHRVTGSWQETLVTWNNQPTFEAASTKTTQGDSAFDLTSAVVGWRAGKFPNYGMLVRATYEGGDAQGDYFGWSYCSRESLGPICTKPQLSVQFELKAPYEDNLVEVWYYYSSQHQAAHGPSYIFAQFERDQGTYQRWRLDIDSADVPTSQGPTWAIEVVVPQDWQIVTANGNPIVNTPDTALLAVSPGRYAGTTSWFIQNVDSNNQRLYAGITYHLWFLVADP